MSKKQWSDTHRYLDRLYQSLATLTEKITSLQELYSEAETVCQGEADREPSLFLQMEVLEMRIQADMQDFVRIYRDIQSCVNGVDDPDERLLLQYRYLDCLTPEQIAEKIGCSKKQADRLHQRALAHVCSPAEMFCENRVLTPDPRD